jgi:hypothetical protein
LEFLAKFSFGFSNLSQLLLSAFLRVRNACLNRYVYNRLSLQITNSITNSNVSYLNVPVIHFWSSFRGSLSLSLTHTHTHKAEGIFFGSFTQRKRGIFILILWKLPNQDDNLLTPECNLQNRLIIRYTCAEAAHVHTSSM